MSRVKPKFLVYILILLAAFSLLFIKTSFLDPFKYSAIKILSRPVALLLVPVREAKKILYYHRTFEEYMRLRNDVHTLRARLAGFEELSRENHRLARLLGMKGKLIYSSVAANVVGRDPSNWNAGMIIDKGSDDDVMVGQPVVDALGVVGKIAEVSGDTAKVILITDPGFSVAALDQRSREVGLVSGTLQGLCRMRYLSAEADIAAGDQIITSKLSSSFPEGLLIGQVTEVLADKGNNTAYGLIQPSVSLSQLEEVLVIMIK